MFVPIEPADCAERSFYSIQIEALTNLQNAITQVDLLKKKNKFAFLKKTNIPGKGDFYRVYMGKFTNRGDALKVWKKLILDGAVSYGEIHKCQERFDRKETRPSQAIVVPKDEELFRVVPLTKAVRRFVNNQNDTVTDLETNLMWIQNGRRFDFFFQQIPGGRPKKNVKPSGWGATPIGVCRALGSGFC